MNRYAVLPQLAGRWFLVIGALARLPFAMVPIGVMLLVTTTSGSVASGGLATSAAAIGTAILGPLHGRLADRYGQRPVLLTATIVSAAGMVGVTVAAVLTLPLPVVLSACLVVGGTIPQVGPFARVRWMALTESRPTALKAAMGWEGMVDELTFVLGPALVGVIASVSSPSVLLTAAVIVAVFGAAFALHRTSTPAADRGPSTVAPATTVAVLKATFPPVLGMCALGAFFGSSQTAVTGFATALGAPGSSGLLYAVMGLGSAATALAVVGLPARITARMRWAVGACGMAAMMAAAMTVTTTVTVAAVLLITGLFLGPVIVTLFTVCSEMAPEGAASTAMTLLVSANVVGVSLGSAIGGQAVEAASASGLGAQFAFIVPALSAALLASSAALLRRDRVAPQ